MHKPFLWLPDWKGGRYSCSRHSDNPFSSNWYLFKTVLLLLIRHHLDQPEKQTAKQNDTALGTSHSFWLQSSFIFFNFCVYIIDSDTSNTFHIIQEKLAKDMYCKTINRTCNPELLSQLPSSVKLFCYVPLSWFLLSLGFSENLKEQKNTSKEYEESNFSTRKY